MQLVKEPTPKRLVRGLFTLLSDLLRRCLRFLDVCSLEGLQPRYFFFYVAALGSTTVRAECYPAEVEPTVYLYQAAGTGPPAQPTKLQACEVWWAKTQAASYDPYGIWTWAIAAEELPITNESTAFCVHVPVGAPREVSCSSYNLRCTDGYGFRVLDAPTCPTGYIPSRVNARWMCFYAGYQNSVLIDLGLPAFHRL